MKRLGGKRGVGIPGYGVGCLGEWKTRGLVENTGSGRTHGVSPYFLPNYVFSSPNPRHLCLKRVSRSNMQIKHFVKKNNMQEPTYRALFFVFFWGGGRGGGVF